MSAQNRPEISRSLAQLLNIKGTMPAFESGERLLPTVDVLQLQTSPYGELGLPVGRFVGVGAVAAENGFCWVSPGVNVTLELLWINIIVAAAAASFRLCLLTQAEQAAIGVTSFVRLHRLRQRNPGVATPNFVEATSSVIDTGSQVGLVGANWGRVQVPANSDRIIDCRGTGISLYGDVAGAGNIQGVGVACEQVNTAFDVAMVLREWPQPV